MPRAKKIPTEVVPMAADDVEPVVPPRKPRAKKGIVEVLQKSESMSVDPVDDGPRIDFGKKYLGRSFADPTIPDSYRKLMKRSTITSPAIQKFNMYNDQRVDPNV